MRIALVNLTGGGFSGGYRKYLRQLVPLLAQEEGVQLQVWNPAGTEAVFGGAIPEHALPRRDAAHRQLRAQVAASGADVVFIPTARFVGVRGIPTVTMVRNMEPLAVPFGGNAPVDAAKNVIRRIVARQACRRADRIIAVSAYVADWLVEHWSVPAARIGVVHHGVETPLPPAQARRPATLPPELPRQFVFTAGSIRPARGLEDLLDALQHMLAAGRPVHAVIAGSTTPQTARYARQLHDRIEQAGLARWITWAGQLGETEMAWAFQHCAAFVMTTRAEACPNTALEALAYGTSIVATDGAPLPEICGDAAAYYRAGDGADLAQRLHGALSAEASARDAVAARARSRAAHFQWSITAMRTLQELRHAVALRRGAT